MVAREDALEIGRRNTGSVVPDLDLGLAIHRPEPHVDALGVRGVPNSVGQQIKKNLIEPLRIAAYTHRYRGGIKVDRLALSKSLRHLNGLCDERDEVYWLEFQDKLAVQNARDVQQVIYQTRKLCGLGPEPLLPREVRAAPAPTLPRRVAPARGAAVRAAPRAAIA
jgi:hypothetical protein